MRTPILAIMLTLSLQALPTQAATIALNDWWLQTDSLGGLRQSTYAPDMYFAVAQDNVWSKGDVYEAPTGFHWASSSEASALLSNSNIGPNHVYYNKGGWTGYQWEGKSRYFFRFSDSHLNDSYKHAGNYDSFTVQYTSNTNYFAGLVLIKNAVPAPAPLGAGLAALVFVGLGVRRRKHAS